MSSPRAFKHFLYVPFTGLGLHDGYRGDEWLANRIKVFRHFVVPSLLNQTNKEFILWISWRPEEENNPQVIELYKDLSQIFSLLFTFNGIMFWDDKYPDEVAAQRLDAALKATLPQLQRIVADAEYVYFTLQPSDDMYISRMVADVQDALIPMRYDKGYIMDYSTKELAEYNPDTLPPFYTLCFTKEDFLNPDKWPKDKSHEYIEAGAADIERGFCVGTHGENISTVFNHPFKGRVIEGDEKTSILISLGILYQQPLKVGKTGLRLWLRIILNKLPFEKQLRKVYHKLKLYDVFKI